MELRPYQIEAKNALLAEARLAWQKKRGLPETPGHRVLAVQPTGAGKTMLMLATAQYLIEKMDWSVLVIVPTRELREQTLVRAGEELPGVAISRLNHACSADRFVVTTGAALTQKKLDSIARDRFQLVFFDEGHHVASKGMRKQLHHFDSFLSVGLTATPIRGDGINIACQDYFPRCVVWNTIAQLTEWGFLVPARGIYVDTTTSLSNVNIEGSDFNEQQLAREVNTPERNSLAVESYRKYATQRKAIVFCVNVMHAQDMAGMFRQAGLQAEAVWGDMNPDKYKQTIQAFRNGEIQILCNVYMLIEGFDVPDTSCVLLARPATEAAGRVLGPQMIGRALRLANGKKEAVIIELRDQDRQGAQGTRKSRSLIGSAMGIPDPEEFEAKRKDAHLHRQSQAYQQKEAWKERQRLLENLALDGLEETFSVIERVQNTSNLAWLPLGSSLFMQLGDGDFIEIVPNHFNFEVKASRAGSLQLVGFATNQGEALQIADRWVIGHGLANNVLQQRTGAWREREPKPAQLEFAHSLTGITMEELKSFKRGSISDLIATALALKR